ncbi:hypothetical protein ACFTXJ_17960 [Streptomyces zhihengii]|uniref:hypothetical protein n=1 Tax=Streptomyces zhihengii TaxID=1818004 RepID=UPI00362978F3
MIRPRRKARPARPFDGGAIELREQDRDASRTAAAPDAPAWSPSARGAVLVPALAALALGLWGLTRQGTLWRDESVTYQVAHRSLPEIMDLLSGADAVHGLHYLAMHALFGVWDGGLLTLRLPSAVAVAAAAGLVAATGLRLTGRPAVGLVAGLVFAVTPEVQMYAQEGRSYALVCALVALATWQFTGLGPDATPGRWFRYGAVVLTASLLHEFAVLALLAHGVALRFSPAATSRARRCFAVTAAAVAVALAPLAVLSAAQSGQVSWISGPGAREWCEIAGFAALAVACRWFLARRGGSAAAVGTPALALALLPTAVLLSAAVHQPVYVDRYVLYSHTGLALLVGAALVRAADGAGRVVRGRAARAAAVGAAGLLCASALLPVSAQMRTPDSRKDDVTAIAAEAARLSAGADAVLFTPARRREWTLSYPGRLAGTADIALAESPAASGTLQGTEVAPGEIGRRLARARVVLVLADPEGQPLDATPAERVKRRVLARDFTVCARTDLKGGRVTLYARTVCPPAAAG